MTAERFDLPALRVEGRDQLIRDALAELAVTGATGVTGSTATAVDRRCDAMVVTSLTNVRWLTGFTGSNATVVVGPDETVLVTDGRYKTQAPLELERSGSSARVVIAGDLVAAGAEAAAAAALVQAEDSAWTVALEDSVSWAIQRRWADHLTEEPVPTTELVEQLRAVKSAPEIERIQAAAAIVDDVLADLSQLIRAGTSERTLAHALDEGMRTRGASGPAYETIVASGPNSALPHARPTDREFVDGDLVIIDAGALVDGYRSDMTRTFSIGAPSARAREMIDTVTSSQAAGVALVAPDVEAGAVDALCREVIDAAQMGDAFVHGTGHGVGLDIHELPRVRKGSTAILRPGHVLTVEPGVYYPDFGGVRVEDTVVVTEDGCRALTRYPKATISG